MEHEAYIAKYPHIVEAYELKNGRVNTTVANKRVVVHTPEESIKVEKDLIKQNPNYWIVRVPHS